MKKQFLFLASIVSASVLLNACNWGASLSTPENAPTASLVAESATEENGISTATPEDLTPMDLAGPPMVVGSKFAYVDGSVLAAVPGGPFIMGYNNYMDTPEKQVALGDFWIYSSEVTNAQYALCVSLGKCSPPDAKNNPTFGNYRFVNLPVVGVNYQQASDYCSFVNGRLPTEAEWEKAARGPDGNLFPWGDQAPSCDLLNFNFCKGKVVDIQSYPGGASFYGLFDMSGNVREWVSDWYSPNYYKDAPTEDPLGPELGEKRSVRSSSLADSADFAFSAHRFSYKPEENLPDLGFRCVVKDPTFLAPACVQQTFTGYGPDGKLTDCVPGVSCNDVDISQTLGCASENNPRTIVTFTMTNDPPSAWAYNAPGCDPLATNKFECYPGDGPDVNVTGSCVLDEKSCVPGCPPNYTQKGDSCVWNGSRTPGTACLPGSVYDPVNKCCTATPNGDGTLSLCPAGSYLLNGVCVDSPSAVVDSLSQPLKFDSCVPPEHNGDCDPAKDPTCSNSCQPQVCSNRKLPQWCSVTCSCIPATAPCK
ncbi:MAG: SUMF1/EgtB/PvdO family nonheme iron enzyme [Anaerolineales bacterium]|nr:SUMF1/EgtB/PvdO family nonheme iron enzyme [Anaerolineales bacterium]